MENAADALKMAGAVLLFVLALSIIIPFFSQARQTADIILDTRDRETVYINGKNYYESTGYEREVGIETIMPTIIRSYIENYKIVFENLSEPIYTIKLTDGTEVKKYSLDLDTNEGTKYKNVTLGSTDAKSEFLCGILYGQFREGKDKFNQKFHITVGKSLYEQLQGKKIKEYLGVYYQNDSEDVPDVNKEKKRIITYKVE